MRRLTDQGLPSLKRIMKGSRLCLIAWSGDSVKEMEEKGSKGL